MKIKLKKTFEELKSEIQADLGKPADVSIEDDVLEVKNLDGSELSAANQDKVKTKVKDSKLK